MNSRANAGGCSQAQWALGRELRLPYCLLDNAGRLSLHGRFVSDEPFPVRIAIVEAAQGPASA
eukprot:279039-Pyramimonas_sp.AAC.1